MTDDGLEDIDVELRRDASLRGVVGSVGRPDAGPLAVAILDTDWMGTGVGGAEVPADSPTARLAAHLAVNEPGGEEPRPLVQVKGLDHYRVDSSYITEAKKRLDETG